jgi:hypothetical protein
VLWIALLALGTSSGISPALARPHPQGGTTITLSPTPASISGCGQATVDVMINDVVDLYGGDVRISFDPTVLEVVDADGNGGNGVQIAPSIDLLDPGPYGLWTIRNEVDNDTGFIWYAVTQLNPAVAVSGSGVFATITFRAKSAGTSALTFEFSQLSTRYGEEIPATTTDGSVTTSAGALTPPDLSIERLDATTARLSWTGVGEADEYHLYRATEPYFTPSGTPYQTTTPGVTSYDDAGALGDVSTNYFYVARSACANGFESENSVRVGEFDYELRETAGTDYNWIALPLSNSSIVTAHDLANYVEANSSSSVQVNTISKWNTTAQSPEFYYHQYAFGDFPVLSQYPYRIETDITGNNHSVLTLVGLVPLAGSCDYSLSETSGTDYNWIMLPLEMGYMTMASQLAADIESNASSSALVNTVGKWNGTAQSPEYYFHQYLFNDFAISLGYPYQIEVDVLDGTSTVWP